MSKLTPEMIERQWKPGQSGNPRGRAAGIREKFNADFVGAFAKDFEKHGLQAIIDLREKDKATYMRVAASMLTKEINTTHNQSAWDDLSDDELETVLNALGKLNGLPSGGASKATAAQGGDQLPAIH